MSAGSPAGPAVRDLGSALTPRTGTRRRPISAAMIAHAADDVIRLDAMANSSPWQDDTAIKEALDTAAELMTEWLGVEIAAEHLDAARGRSETPSHIPEDV